MVTLTWRSRLTDEDTAAVLALLRAVTEADGAAPTSEAVLLRLRHGDPAEHLLAIEQDGGRDTVVGYAHLDPAVDATTAATAELAVHPGHRRRGAATAMVRELMAHAAPSGLRLWAHGEHPGAGRLAQRYGFTRARVLLQLRRSLLAPFEDPALSDGVRLRPFVVDQDEAAVVEVNNRAFSWHPEQGGWDVQQVRLREAEPWFDPAGFLLAVSDDGAGGERLLGFHWTKQHSAELGEVYVLGVDPAEHGRGLGKALTLAGLAHLRSRGMTTVMLYVEADNEPAVRTYQRLGFTQWSSDVAYSSP